jgi:hypothetical protein
MKTALRAVASLALVCLPLAGCLEVEEGIRLQPDLSGTATVRFQMDMNGMIPFIAKMQRDMQGKPGEPTAEELAEVKKQILEKQQADQAQEDAELAEKRKQLEATLPPGIKLEAFEVNREELKMGVRMSFAFDHVSKLPSLELPAEKDGDEGAPAGAPSEEKMKKPFENLVVEETADQVTITFKPTSPLADEKPADAQGGEGEDPMGGAENGMPGMEEMVKDMTKDMKVVFVVTTPLAVAESNETKKDGETLTWTFDRDTLEKLGKKAEAGDAAAPPTPRVVLKKQK